MNASSNTRRIVLFFAVTLAIITYVDRVCISQAAPASASSPAAPTKAPNSA